MPIFPVPLLSCDILSHSGPTLSLAFVISLDSYILLPIVASQIPTPDCLVPTLPDPVDPQVWDLSTPAIVTHHLLVLVYLKDLSSFPPRRQLPVSETHHHSFKPIIMLQHSHSPST